MLTLSLHNGSQQSKKYYSGLSLIPVMWWFLLLLDLLFCILSFSLVFYKTACEKRFSLNGNLHEIFVIIKFCFLLMVFYFLFKNSFLSAFFSLFILQDGYMGEYVMSNTMLFIIYCDNAKWFWSLEENCILCDTKFPKGKYAFSPCFVCSC